MERQHVDISQDLDGEAVVFACFDLREEEIRASAHAVAASAAERYRNTEMSGDDVIELRELTVLAVRGLLVPLEQLSAEAMRAALAPSARPC